MPAVLSANEIVREDLSDALILADVRNTPVTSRMKKGDKLKNMLFSWSLEKLGARRSGGIPENKDVDAFESDQMTRIYGRGERFWRTPRVSVIAEKVNDVAGVTGSKYNWQVTKKIKDQKRDIENEMVSDQDSQDDNGVVGSKFMGLGRVINDTTSVGASGAALTFGDAQTAIPVDYRTPTAQIYTGALASLGEPDFISILKSRYDNLGATTELSLFADSALKSHISEFFGKYKPNKDGFVVVVRSMSETIDSRKFPAYGIDLYEGDFGTFDITLVPFMPYTGRGYGLNMEYMSMRPLMYCDHTELPYQGGGISGLIDSILGYEFGDPRGHFKIDPAS